jgi:hypothetical protein
MRVDLALKLLLHTYTGTQFSHAGLPSFEVGTLHLDPELEAYEGHGHWKGPEGRKKTSALGGGECSLLGTTKLPFSMFYHVLLLVS